MPRLNTLIGSRFQTCCCDQGVNHNLKSVVQICRTEGEKRPGWPVRFLSRQAGIYLLFPRPGSGRSVKVIPAGRYELIDLSGPAGRSPLVDVFDPGTPVSGWLKK